MMEEAKEVTEAKLYENINTLMDRIEENEDLKHILSDREQNKLISQNTLDKMRQEEQFKKTPFQSYDGTLDNLLDLAKNNDSIAEAIEIDSNKMMEFFEKIQYRYALIKEDPKNYDSLLYFEFGIKMPKIHAQVQQEEKRIREFNESVPSTWRERRNKKKQGDLEYDYSQSVSYHNYSQTSFLDDVLYETQRNNIHQKQSIPKLNIMYFKTSEWGGWTQFNSAKFDKLGRISIFPITEEDKIELGISGYHNL